LVVVAEFNQTLLVLRLLVVQVVQVVVALEIQTTLA
jgi:hypothetical protein